ncbi:MAG TPA: ABC transporter ATP-binding protein [Longimicrobiaceae bacterium]|nr:ABC transporter ATP-binding protein [Longimicrobiaceae bacterium]
MALLYSAPQLAPPQPRTRQPLVRLEGLTKRFPVRRRLRHLLLHPFRSEYAPVIRDVTCEIGEGEFFGLLGPNGAGKTTLFKMLATLVLPDEGAATIAGYDVVRDAALVRRVLAPVIADERSLYWRLSARENLKLFAVLHRLDNAEIRARVEEVLRAVGLEDTAEKMVGQFSSGMKQRLLIARALLSRPRVLLLDEPTRSLDPISARRFRLFLREEILGRQGCTVLLATHNTEEALELCDRVAVLDRGRLLAVGSAQELSREISEDRYRLWTKAPDHPALASLAARGRICPLGAEPADAEGWVPLRIEVPGNTEAAADVLASLALEGMPIARFERIPLALADLIERIILHADAQGGEAGEVGHA